MNPTRKQQQWQLQEDEEEKELNGDSYNNYQQQESTTTLQIKNLVEQNRQQIFIITKTGNFSYEYLARNLFVNIIYMSFIVVFL